MKNYLLLFFIIISAAVLNAQVIVSPYMVFTEEGNRYGSFIVQNESNENYEVTLSFVFGYPISDSLGNISMNYVDSPAPSDPSIVDWIRAFPKKFVLAPKERQVVRMSVKPPAQVDPGTYWARIVTSASPQSPSIDTLSTGLSAKIRFVLNQVTTIVYRTGFASTGIEIKNLEVISDTSGAELRTTMERTGNSPFIGRVYLTLTDDFGNLISENEEYLIIYYTLVKNLKLSETKLPPGNYKAELKIIFNEKEDIPNSKLDPLPPEIRTVNFTIN